MTSKPLLWQQPVTIQNHKPTPQFVEIIQILARMVDIQQAEIAALAARVETQKRHDFLRSAVQSGFAAVRARWRMESD